MASASDNKLPLAEPAPAPFPAPSLAPSPLAANERLGNGGNIDGNTDGNPTSNDKQDNSPVSVSVDPSAPATTYPFYTAALPARIASDTQGLTTGIAPDPIRPASSAPSSTSLALAQSYVSACSTSTSAACPSPSTSHSVHELGSGPTQASRSNTPLGTGSPAAEPSPPATLPSPTSTRPHPPLSQPTRATKGGTLTPVHYNTPQHQPLNVTNGPVTPAPAPAAAPVSGSGSLTPVPKTGFPSPGRDQVHANRKFLDDKTRITYGIQQAIPEAVRRSVRDNWEKCLIGSDFHQAFILNASIHHATPGVIQRGMRDFGRAMISAAKSEIVDSMTPADIDSIAERLLAKASDSFLDKALEIRLRSIDAKRLINALARAERLGYEPSDVQAVDGDQATVQPASTERRMPSPATKLALDPAPHLAGVGASLMYCGVCFRKFDHRSAHDHHVLAKVCTRTPSSPGGFQFACQHCGQGFTTAMGVQFHIEKKVCGDFSDPSKSNPTAARAKTSPLTRAAAATPTSTTASAATSTRNVPRPTSSGGDSRHGTLGLQGPDSAAADPYAHLAPEQLAAMQEELRKAELNYTERFRQAGMIPDPAEKKARLDGLANSFATKQSLIRKKYGVRLRMRRTKAEIEAERDRMQYKTAAELTAELGITSTHHLAPGRPVTSGPRPATTITLGSNGGTGTTWSNVIRPGAQPTSSLASSLPLPNHNAAVARAIDVSMHGGNKRPFSGSGASPDNKRVAYAEMGGLSGGIAAEAETTDPTRPRDAAGVVPIRTGSTASIKGMGTAEEPMALDETDSESGTSRQDDEDIPAQLPASVLQSLQQA